MYGAALFGTIVGLGMTFVLMYLIFYVLLVVAGWMIFTKAGEAGWKSIIPIYNSYIFFKISWETKWFWINILLTAVGSVMARMQNALSYVGYIALFAAVVIGLMQMYKLAKVFGHGVGFTIGLICLPNVFTLILGFGSSRYIGPQ